MNARGRPWEDLALAHLRGHGLVLLARNFQTRFGELDLVMRDGDVVVFVEVRYRTHRHFGGGAGSVDTRKQRKLVTAAQQFLQAHPPLARLPCRLDVVALGGDPDHPAIDWLRSAFEA